jgi:hypothetical protein
MEKPREAKLPMARDDTGAGCASFVTCTIRVKKKNMSKEHDKGRGLEELMNRDGNDDDEGAGSETKTCGKEMRSSRGELRCYRGAPLQKAALPMVNLLQRSFK